MHSTQQQIWRLIFHCSTHYSFLLRVCFLCNAKRDIKHDVSLKNIKVKEAIDELLQLELCAQSVVVVSRGGLSSDPRPLNHRYRLPPLTAQAHHRSPFFPNLSLVPVPHPLDLSGLTTVPCPFNHRSHYPRYPVLPPTISWKFFY